MLLRGNINYLLVQEELAQIKASNSKMTSEIKQRLILLTKKNLYWYDRAESLGWREPSSDFLERYLQSIEDFKAQ